MKKIYDDASARIFKSWPFLGNEELEILLKELQITRDFSIRNKIIENNIGLVVCSLKAVRYQPEELEDLFQVGMEGLIKAVDHFNLEYNVKFSSYAVPKIVGYIKHYRRDNGLVRVSRRIYELNSKILKATEKLNLLLGREPTLKELSVELKISEAKIAEAINSTQLSISLFTPINNGDDENSVIELLDIVADENDEIDNMVTHMGLQKIIGELSQKEKELIYCRYFLKQTQAQIAMVRGCGQMTISRNNREVLTKMRNYLK